MEALGVSASTTATVRIASLEFAFVVILFVLYDVFYEFLFWKATMNYDLLTCSGLEITQFDFTDNGDIAVDFGKLDKIIQIMKSNH